MEHSEIQALKAEILAEADTRYVAIDVCSEKQEAVNKRFANDDKRIDLIAHDFGVIKKLMWVLTSAGVASFVTRLYDIILK